MVMLMSKYTATLRDLTYYGITKDTSSWDKLADKDQVDKGKGTVCCIMKTKHEH